VLSAGRMRLGIGVGWNAVEYEALGLSFSDRGVRSEEQIALLRELWAAPLDYYEGRWERALSVLKSDDLHAWMEGAAKAHD